MVKIHRRNSGLDFQLGSKNERLVIAFLNYEASKQVHETF